MSDYWHGCAVLGEDTWEKPAIVDDPDWGRPVVVSGGGGGHGGGGHGGGHHGGGGGGGGGGGPRPGGFGGWGFNPWLEAGWGPYMYVDDFVDVVDMDPEQIRCIEYDANKKCVKYAPVDVLGDAISEIVGMFDFNVEQRKMNALKVVPVSVAQALLKGGMTAINGAISGAKQPWYKPDLPGDNSRQVVLGKLLWHQTALAPLIGKQDQIYASGEDLKQQVLAAFREANAVEEGAQYMQVAWNTMWSDIAEAMKKLPAEVRKQVGNLVQDVTGIPVWGWVLVGVGVLVLLGGMIYLIVNSKAGAAAAHVAASRYLP